MVPACEVPVAVTPVVSCEVVLSLSEPDSLPPPVAPLTEVVTPLTEPADPALEATLPDDALGPSKSGLEITQAVPKKNKKNNGLGQVLL